MRRENYWTDQEVWSTKSWNTKGILHYRVRSADFDEYCACVPSQWGMNGVLVLFKPFWHDTKAEALEHFENLRKKKIVSLKKQLVKIENLEFKIVEGD
jgi:hypothetical protein